VKRERLRAELVREYIKAHLAENIALDRLAQIACLSLYHIHRVFCHEIGLAPHQYQIQARITRDRKLLREGMTLKKFFKNLLIRCDRDSLALAVVISVSQLIRRIIKKCLN
jgi:AraC-like DNA-binding protein